ncbi:MAG: hypothetical protein HWN51_02825 [Desulfobacterales bacterium]|nr:hypothetical protein [Desulfobacterales bacterium]
MLCAFIVLGLAAASAAYILPAKQILAFMIRQFGSGRTLMVSQKTVLYDPRLEGGMQELDETLYYGYPDRFRSEVMAPGVEQIRVINTDGALIVHNGKIIGEMENPFDHFKDLLLYRETELLVGRLSQLGINFEVVSLGRFKDKIAYVIGARYPDESVPQAWIDKKSFRPVRFIVRGDDGKDVPSREIQYTDYRPLDKGKSYPARMLFFENGTLVRMHVLKTFKINPAVPDQLFDIAYIKSMYEPIASTQPTPLPASELDEVKKSIQDFKKIFE